MVMNDGVSPEKSVVEIATSLRMAEEFTGF